MFFGRYQHAHCPTLECVFCLAFAFYRLAFTIIFDNINTHMLVHSHLRITITR